MRTAPALTRTILGALFALLIALRTLGATGYMPSFEHGRLAIAVCPDADANSPLALDVAHHHHGKSNHHHALCPYASASALGAVGTGFAGLFDLLIFGTALLLLGRTFLFLERSRAHERPPLRGPPLPA